MSGRRLFDRDSEMGTETFFHYNHDDDSATIETVQQVDDVVSSNRRDFNDAPNGWSGDMHRVASIPMTLYLQLKEQGIVDDKRAFKAWLNDPDNRAFRTRPGRV